MSASITHALVSAVTDDNVAGEVGPSEWNAAHVISELNIAFIGAKAYHSTTQGSLSASTVNALNLDSEEYDTDGFHDTSSNTSRMTIPAGLAGKYLAIAKTKVNQNFEVYIRKNGSTILRGGEHQSSGFISSTQVMVDMSAGDYLEAVEFHDSGTGTAGDASNDHLRTELSIVKLDSGKLGQGIGARVRHGSSISLTTDPQVVLWDTEDFDTDGFHSTSSNTGRMTVPTGMGGIYSMSVVLETNSSNGLRVQIRKNGSGKPLVLSKQFNGDFVVFVDATTQLAAGDYVEAVITGATSGSLINTDIEGSFTFVRLDSGGSPVLNASRFTDTGTHANYTTTSGTFADIDGTNLSLTITTGARRVLLGFMCLAGNSASATTAFDFTVDGTRQGHTTLGLTGTNHAATAVTMSYLTAALSAGSHTFTVQWKVSSGTGTVFANTTGVAVHFYAIEQVM